VPPGFLSRVEALISQHRYAEAEAALRPLRDTSPYVQYLTGFTLIRLYRYAEAEEMLRQAVAEEPGQHAWLHLLAKALLEQGRNLAALEVLDRAVAIEPRGEYRFARAMCLLNVGDLSGAETELRKCLDRQPEHSEALFKLGEILLDRGDYEASRSYLRACLEANPRHLEARYLLGLAESRVGDPEAAMSEYRRVIEEIPGHVGALYNLGRTLIQVGQAVEGQRWLEEFRATSKLQDEIEFLRKAVRKNPTNVDGRILLAERLLQVGRNGEALEQLLAGRGLEPGRAGVYELMAEVFGRLGRDEDARGAAELARQLREVSQ
jgi:tetratricopeptide (TPR) repeat protein